MSMGRPSSIWSNHTRGCLEMKDDQKERRRSCGGGGKEKESEEGEEDLYYQVVPISTLSGTRRP